MGRSGKTIDRRTGGSSWREKPRGGRALERGVEVRKRLLHDMPGGHIRAILPITNHLSGNHRRKYQWKQDAAEMHTGLQQGRQGKSLLLR